MITRQLDTEDINMLLEGLRALKSQPSEQGLTTMLLTTLLAPSKEAAEKHRNELQQKEDAGRDQRDARRESIMMLEAKLIEIKREAIKV